MLSLIDGAKADTGEGCLKGTAQQGQKKKVVTSLGYVAMTKTWEDGMAGKHSRYLVCLKVGGCDCSLGMCLAVGRV